MKPIRIIVGLGNPGRDYAATRHNVGFMVLDRLAAHFGAEWKPEKAYKAEIAAGPGVLLVKPQTFMNSSGESVGPLMRYFKFDPEQVFVVYDDISFPVGTMRLRAGGSAGGHNGMKSLIAHLGTEKFPRLRVGISAPGCKQMVSHVLGKFAPDERPLLDEALLKATAASLTALRGGFDAAANKYTVRKEKKKKEKPQQPEAEQPTEDAAADSSPSA
ncbi:MAG: aminoacyl-tRNA hydrolase [Akkermansia sp.]|nr:aminoacyl-tRNA hydrolase [Akkermansia sp.]